MKVEYRNLPHAGGKVALLALLQEACTNPDRRKSKTSPFRCIIDHSSVYTVVQSLPALFWKVLQSGTET
ncbi:MAG TPA: hypothetical protein VN370_01070 [Desulfitobacteriaceae bacterium]|nr:hypothetical protein [Desulfitobacteriaceae bacterium]